MLDLNYINFADYEDACFKFAEDSKDWEVMQGGYFYTNNGSDWLETCDNSHGGFDLTWCFHMDSNEIMEKSKDEYIHIIKENVRSIISNDCVEDWNKKEIKQYLDWIAEALTIN